ncbi:MAG: nuclear transport factor 2 family protein [Candidatus Bathyarchaeota archaeon]|nr:MAG: nuclear transport factor 2 family protein [Candidatus Bathyarchaeota archaeon]
MDEEEEAIKHVIEEAYIKGVHGDQDEGRIRSGFHQEFAMLVLSNNTIQKVKVEDWLGRITQLKKENPELWKSKTSHDFKLVDVTKNAALAKLNVFKGKTHFSTDYMLLYKFEEGWRIVSKIFTIP